MAPEQIEGEHADHRADLYAMGVILFAVLTGNLPYDDDDVDTLLALHLHEPVPSPLALNPVLAPVWEDIVQRSLAKDPAARFASAREMDAAILAAWQAHQRATDATVETIDPHELASQAALALGQSDWPRVIALCGRILESDPGHHAATYLLSQAQENMRRQRAAQLVQRADESLAAGRLADARRYYQVALTLVPALAPARDGLALLARVDAPTLESPAPAIELSEEAAAWYAQGLAAAAHADWAESIAALRQVVALAPDFHEAGLRLDEAERALAADDGRPSEDRADVLGAATEPRTEVAAELPAVGPAEQAIVGARRPGTSCWRTISAAPRSGICPRCRQRTRSLSTGVSLGPVRDRAPGSGGDGSGLGTTARDVRRCRLDRRRGGGRWSGARGASGLSRRGLAGDRLSATRGTSGGTVRGVPLRPGATNGAGRLAGLAGVAPGRPAQPARAKRRGR